MKFKVTGLAQLNKAIDKAQRDITKRTDAEIKRIADEILQSALARVHVLSGALKASAFVEKIENGYTIGFAISYAAFEEFGTSTLANAPDDYKEYALTFKVEGGRIRNGEPHPYLFPAFLARRDKIVDELSLSLQSYISKF